MGSVTDGHRDGGGGGVRSGVNGLERDGISALHTLVSRLLGIFYFLFFFFNCMFYQLLRVQHSCSSTQSWGSVLPSIVETRDQNSRGCPLLFSNRNLGSFCA